MRCKSIDKERSEKHIDIHGRKKSNFVPYGDPYSPLPLCSPSLEGTLTAMARVPFGKTEEDYLRRNKKTELKREDVWDASAKCFAFNCGKACCISEQRR
jgi:hypothetical protein